MTPAAIPAASFFLPLLDAAPWAVVPTIFVAAFAVLTVAGYVLHLRALTVAPVPQTVDVRPPDERARAALDAAAPLAEIDARAYYGCVGAALRSYLAVRFGLPNHALPRSETQSRLATAGVETATLAAALLERCDTARLGGDAGDAARREADLCLAREIIARTTGA